MTILYIGQYSTGTTSKMRADELKEILSPHKFSIIDTHEPFFKTPKLLRSLGFRYKKGPLITNTNKYIKNKLNSFSVNTYDLIWVDKAVYITKETTELLKQKTTTLVHFTPDPAFTYHQSRHFVSSLPYYDYVVTTKSYEETYYQDLLSAKKVILTTQGFNPKIHRPNVEIREKIKGVLFIGHCEKERETVLQKLINANIHVSVAGINWEKFTKKNHNNPLLTFLGKGIYGPDYAKTLASYEFSWGALSKWIPELHTTRTFEIPACATALITERNSETSSFFTEAEAIFYNSPEEMITKIKYYQNHKDELKKLIQNGRERVLQDGRDYKTIIKRLLDEMGLV